MVGRLKEYREKRTAALAQSRAEQSDRRLRSNKQAWCPDCSFQMTSKHGRMLDFCARCGYMRA